MGLQWFTRFIIIMFYKDLSLWEMSPGCLWPESCASFQDCMERVHRDLTLEVWWENLQSVRYLANLYLPIPILHDLDLAEKPHFHLAHLRPRCPHPLLQIVASCFASGMSWYVVLRVETPCMSIQCSVSPLFPAQPSRHTNLPVSSNKKLTNINCSAVSSASSSTAHVFRNIF